MDLVERFMPAATARHDLEAGLLHAQAKLHALGITAWQDAIVRPVDHAAYLAVAGSRRADRPGGRGAVVGARLGRVGRSTSSSNAAPDGIARPLPGRARSRSWSTASSRRSPARCSSRTCRPTAGPADRTGILFVEPERLRRRDAAARRGGLPGPLPRDRRPGGARGARRRRGRPVGQRTDRRPAPHRPHPGHPSGRHRRASRDSTSSPTPSRSGPPTRPPDGRADDPVPRPAASHAGSTRSSHSCGPAHDWRWARTGASRPPTRCSRSRSRSTGSTAARRTLRPPFLPEERLTLDEAVRAFTIGSAYVNHLDDATGSISVGKLADLIVLDRDLFDRGAGRDRRGTGRRHVRRGRAGVRGPGARRLTLSGRRSAGPAGRDPAAARDARPTARRPRPAAGRSSASGLTSITGSGSAMRSPNSVTFVHDASRVDHHDSPTAPSSNA